MTDEELDKMMYEAVERIDMLDDINRSVMQELKGKVRRKRSRVLWRMVLFAFGMPLGVAIYSYVVYKLICLSPSEPYFVGSIGLSALASLYFIVQRINNFSLSDV